MDLHILDLQRRCISSILGQLIRVNRTDSIKDLPLPSLMVQRIEGIHEWKDDLANMLLRVDDCPLAARCISNAPLFSDHYRWTSENTIDRRATAAAQLDNLDPKSALQRSIEFGFVLASTYCLEDHVRRLWPHCNTVGSLPAHTNYMGCYWTTALKRVPNQFPNRNGILAIRSRERGSDQFWLDVIRSYWSVTEQLDEIDRRQWVQLELTDAMEYHHKRCVAFAWSRYTADMRNTLASEATHGITDSIQLLKLTIRANEKEIFVDIFKQCEKADARRAIIWHIIDKVYADFYHCGTNLVILERLLDLTSADQACFYGFYNFDVDIARPICERLLTIWDSLSPKLRDKVSNNYNFDDLFRSAIASGFVKLASCIWIEEHDPVRKFEMVFRDECVAFRMSCANGYTDLVQQFWEWASTDQRCRMVGCKFDETLNTAARNGHLSVIRYLWENMDARVACAAIDSNGLDHVSLSQLIIDVSSSNKAGGSHELEDFLVVLISTPNPADEHRTNYPCGAMKEILVAALSLGNGKALEVLLQRAVARGDPTVLRTLLQAFNDEQRVRLRSKLTTEDDIEFCGLEKVETNNEHVNSNESTEDDENEEDEEDEEKGEMIDLTELDEYYDG